MPERKIAIDFVEFYLGALLVREKFLRLGDATDCFFRGHATVPIPNRDKRLYLSRETARQTLRPGALLEVRGDAAVFPVAITDGIGAFAAAQFAGLSLSLSIALAAALFSLGEGAAGFRRQLSFR